MRKIDFQDGRLRFPSETILAFFHLQVIPMTSTKFQVSWPFGSGEEAKIYIFIFSSLISDRTVFFFVFFFQI